ncbi:MAG: hypothetical protein ACOYLQ_09440 [Hyphomicrobiaceae bacterium]
MAARLVAEFGISMEEIQRMPIDRLIWWVDAIADHYQELKDRRNP